MYVCIGKCFINNNEKNGNGRPSHIKNTKHWAV